MIKMHVQVVFSGTNRVVNCGWITPEKILFFYNLLNFSSNFKEYKLLVRFASVAVGLLLRSSQKPVSHQCRDV